MDTTFKTIPISGAAGRGLYALVSPEDYDRLVTFRWFIMKDGYAYRSAVVDGRRTSVLMHRDVLTAPRLLEVDHINHHVLDNRRENLRLVTRKQNGQNRRGARRDSSTGVRGVCRTPVGYVARIYKDGRAIHVGHFRDLATADAAVRAARAEHFTHSSECTPVEATL